ncbi:MAG: hypothetical protein PHN61_04050 [Methanothrix sp.]|nr:hypothetical protein [Methanothrix sp.]
MTANAKSGFISRRICMICISVLLTAGLMGTGAADSFSSIYKSQAPQTAVERAELFKSMQNSDVAENPQNALNGADLYKALQNPYDYNDPQAALERASTYRELQKNNAIYSSSRIDDNWPYWANMWLNGPQGISGALDDAAVYSALSNPYAFNDPQAALELANTYKELRKYNGIYSSSRIDDNWYYWSNMWLNGQ